MFALCVTFWFLPAVAVFQHGKSTKTRRSLAPRRTLIKYKMYMFPEKAHKVLSELRQAITDKKKILISFNPKRINNHMRA